MPVAQWHYPFENQKEFETYFPADYICEAVDQTRGWFYSLHAISTLLFNEVCFKNVICLGLILDENGQKMSKTKGNVVDPWPVINQNGADAMRWYLYTASPPGQERRFSSNLVGEVVRNFILTLWNTYSFFVTYANLDGWTPGGDHKWVYSDLDKWLRSELHALVRDVTEAFEKYDVLAATRPVEVFIDKLSNWYLRRSRRRFWKSGSDEDKQAAYATLYETLVTVTKLLAPAMPFLTEEMYQNLVVRTDKTAPLSVHLAEWPAADPGVIDDKLNREMDITMHLASLGHAARNKANRKVRQPLLEAAFSVGSQEEQAAVLNFSDLLEDELNVKHVRLLSSATEAVSYSLNPYPKQLGQKYGSAFPAIRQALLGMDPVEAGKTLLSGESVIVQVNGEALAILPEEVEVRVTAREGLAVANEGAYLAALETDLTPELIEEGLAREFIRRVQDLRKSADFDIADRIEVYFQPTDTLKNAIEANREFIMGEVLARNLILGEAPVGCPKSEDDFDGEHVSIGIKRNS
jgi:isoleucyl-tRNA synthetase